MEMLNMFDKYVLTPFDLLNDVSKSTASAEQQQLLGQQEEQAKVDTNEAQHTHLDSRMKPPKSTVDKEESHQFHVETSEKLAVDTDHETTQVNDDNTCDSNENHP